MRRALAWQQNAWELPSSPCDDPGELSLIFESLKRGQGSREVIYSFRRIQRGLTCSWQVFIYTFSPLLTRLRFSSLLSLLGEQNALASPWKYIVHLRRRRLTKNKLDSFSPPILNSCIIYIPCLWLFNYAITAVVLLHRDILKSTHKITIEISCLTLTGSSPTGSWGKIEMSWTIFPLSLNNVSVISVANLFFEKDREKSHRVIYFFSVVFNWGVMAGLNFICSKGAAGPGEATEEIDFVPHILSCSSWLALGWHGAMLGRAGVQYGLMHFFISDCGRWLYRCCLEAWKHGSRVEHVGKVRKKRHLMGHKCIFIMLIWTDNAVCPWSAFKRPR